jgi:hypothetical protein
MIGFLESPKQKLISLQQDNDKKIKIVVPKDVLETEIKSITRWRKDVLNRFYSLGSTDYDNIIYKLSLKGY